MWSIDSALKKEIPTLAMPSMNLEDNMPSEVSPSPKDTLCVIPLTGALEQPRDTDPPAAGCGCQRLTEMLFSLEDGKFWRRMVGTVTTANVKHRTGCLKLGTTVNLVHFLPHFKKE